MGALKREDVTGTEIWRPHVPTRSEQIMADALRKAGLKYAKEVPVKGFTVDFLLDEWLVVEVDGESHLTSGHKRKDLSRQKVLEDSGFTVLRVPAGELFSRGNVNRWVKQIRDMVASPPHLSRGGFLNTAYRKQMEDIKKALSQGEAEQRKRESLAFKPSGETAPIGPEESMSDYFGKEAEDFGALLKEYDWQKGERASGEEPGKTRPGATISRKQRPGGKGQK